MRRFHASGVDCTDEDDAIGGGTAGERPGKPTPELRDTGGYPFVSGVIRSLPVSRTAFCHHFPKERIRALRD